ncbi:unnamed protein product [Cuscuta europaea]|uniref:Replication factor A C-terminal domain-containing protein n=1 Tax=Cuscuta europaea TaxID=41803 RepID=A0A9P1E9P6_CUSEU|nr:unnamed protein product [Cuscuta europaea]
MKSIASQTTSSCVTLREDSIDVGFTMPLFDLDTAKEVKGCWFYAQICSILSLKNWAYLGCGNKTCFKKLKYEGASLYCNNCRDVKQTGIWWYMLKLMVKHGKHFVEVVMWDDVSSKLIGKPANDLSDSLSLETLSPCDVHNDVLDLIGRELIFKVGNRKVNTLTNQKEYTIAAFSENTEKIKELKEAVQEEVVEVYNSDSDLDLMCDDYTNVESNMTPCSQEIESHRTPESVLSKRHATDENESDGMEQSSVNKKFKGVKIEI